MFLILLTLLASSPPAFVAAAGKPPPPKFPAILAFGDSSVDTGNNNYIATTFRGDHPPYGLNYPAQAATGRLSDGRLVPDFLASLTGLKNAVPPFLDPSLSDSEIATGVNFASAGSGLDDLTTALSGVTRLLSQLGHFREYIARLEGILGKQEATRVLVGALVIVSIGSNDFIFNFYDLPTRRVQFTIDEYQDFLQMKLRDFIKEMYHLGCRKMVVSGLPPIGCLPIQMTAQSPILRGCSRSENADARSYNQKLIKLLSSIEKELPGSKILYVDVYNPLMDIIDNPQNYGFEDTSRGCCGTGFVETGPLCTLLSPVCADPTGYVFWDSIHPGESTYKILSESLVDSLSVFNTSDSLSGLVG